MRAIAHLRREPPRPPATAAGAAALASLGLLIGALAGVARADAVRPSLAVAAPGRAAAGPSPVFRGDGRRTGSAPGAPSALGVLWTARLGEALDVPPVADARSLVAATSSGAVVTLDRATGRETARASLPAPPVVPLALTGRGDRVAVTAGGEVVALTSSGRTRFRRPLPARPNELTTSPLLTGGGGVLVAAGDALLLLDGGGELVDEARLPEATTGALVEAPSGGALAVTETGKVFRWSPPASPALLGSLGGPPSFSPAVAGKALVSVVEGKRLVFFDLAAGAPGVVVTPPLALEAAPAVGAGGEVWMTTAAGLVAVDATGAEAERAAGVVGEGTVVPPLALPGRRAALVRPSGEAVVWSRDGAVVSEQRACAEPVGLIADAAQLIVSCRDGTVVALGAAGRP